MTGFGKYQAELPDKLVTVEVKCLNSKQLDLNIRLPNLFRDREPELRSLVSQKLERGKIDLNVMIENTSEVASYILNHAVVMHYYRQLKELVSGIPGESDNNLLPLVVRMPDVMKANKEEPDESDWMKIMEAIITAIGQADGFRLQEGVILEKDMQERIQRILQLLETVTPFEEERIANARKKLINQFNEIFSNGDFDRNRFEQEIIYYLEKIDITEEKVRLGKHCDYFLETLLESNSNGKKLNFISQEIGREINTMGAKANDVNIQKIVILMKDELEKVKEQLNNIL
jgi:uncharacterized protein (TIGR00255 family)